MQYFGRPGKGNVQSVDGDQDNFAEIAGSLQVDEMKDDQIFEGPRSRKQLATVGEVETIFTTEGTEHELGGLIISTTYAKTPKYDNSTPL